MNKEVSLNESNYDYYTPCGGIVVIDFYKVNIMFFKNKMYIIDDYDVSGMRDGDYRLFERMYYIIKHLNTFSKNYSIIHLFKDKFMFGNRRKYMYNSSGFKRIFYGCVDCASSDVNDDYFNKISKMVNNAIKYNNIILSLK